MRKFYLLTTFLVIALCAVGQDWVNNKSNLYYYSNGERVAMTPDYSSLAIYFKDVPAKGVVDQLKSTVNERFANSGNTPETHSMASKGVIRILNAESFRMSPSTKKADFLATYGLRSTGAYDVLPSFTVEGTQMWMTKRVNLGLKPNVQLSSIQGILNKYDAVLQKSRLNGSFLTVNVDKLENQLPLIQELAAKGFIQWGEPDFKAEIKRYNDPLYQYQWHLNNTGGVDWSGNFALTAGVDIDADLAWGISTGSSNITVAVIDDGMVNHEDFPTLLNGYTPSTNGDGTPDYSTNPYHGQPCGGLIFAQHNSVGVRGVAPGVNAFSVNIFESSTTNADVADGVIWAVDQGADVLSNSWGFGSCTANLVPSISNAFSYAATSGRGGLGCVILVASGNDFQSCVSFPANLSTVTAVGAVNGSGTRSNFSNTGSDLDITAPSNEFILNQFGQVTEFRSDIVTTDLPGSEGSNNGLYYYEFGGTSAATPITAGVACLVLSVDPSLTKAQVENILYTTATDYGSNGYDTEYGHGLVNAYQAVLAAGGSSCDLAAPGNFSASSIGDNSFNLSWNSVSGASSYTVTVGGNSTNVSGTSYSATGLTAGTTYTCSVVANCSGGGSGTSTSIDVTTTGTVPVNYCASNGNNTSDEYIGRVQLGSIDNSTGASSGGYGDFTSQSTDLAQGSSNTITITPTWTGTVYSEGYSVWIDYNQDGDFADSGEQVFTQSNTTASPVGGSFTVPASATEGSTRMRVSMKYNGIPTSCESFTYGEVEDYTVNITTDGGGGDPGGCTATSVDSNDFESGWGIWNDGGSDARRSANDAAYSNGTYSIRLRDNTSTSTMTTDNLNLSSFEEITVSFSYYPRSMESGEDFWLQISTNGGSSYSTQATWAQGSEFSNNQRYNESVTLTGTFSSTTRLRFRCDASGNSDYVYIDDVVITGCSSSGASFVATMDELPEIIEAEELDFESIVMYPNPVKDKLMINGMPDDAFVRLITLSGKVLDQGIGRKEFDMSALQNGLYLLHVTIDDEARTFKVIRN